ncbi:uncharacterized protein Dmoj_GI25915, partial [Drosophila mojavensis]
SIKANNNNSNVAAVAGGNNNNNNNITKSVNLIAANATANKILKLATNVANGVDIAQQHKLVDSNNSLSKANGSNVANVATAVVPSSCSTPTKITLPNLVNLGILTPATSPTKNTQTLTFTTTAASQQQQQQQQALVATLTTNMLQQNQKLSNITKTNILLLQEPSTASTHLIQSSSQHHQQQQQQQQQPQQQQHQHVLPISPTSSSSSKSSSPTPPQQQQQHKSSNAAVLKQKHVMTAVAATSASNVEPMDTDEAPQLASDALMLTDNSLCSATAAADGKDIMPSTIATAVNSGTITVAAIEVVGAGVVNTET